MHTRAALVVVLALLSPRCFGNSSSLDFLNRVLSWNETDTQKSAERLSSGRVLLTDDPSGYAIDSALEKYIRGLDVTIRNQTDMISYDSTEEAYTGTIAEVLQRIRELALQSSNGILSDDDRDVVKGEMTQLYDEILFTLNQAEFNGKKLFADLLSSPAIREGFSASPYYEVAGIDRLLKLATARQAALGAQEEALRFSMQGESTAKVNTVGAQSQRDVDFGAEMSAFKKDQLLSLIDVLELAHTGH